MHPYRRRKQHTTCVPSNHVATSLDTWVAEIARASKIGQLWCRIHVSNIWGAEEYWFCQLEHDEARGVQTYRYLHAYLCFLSVSI